METIIATLKRNITMNMRVYRWAFVIGRLAIGINAVLFAYFMYFYLFKGNMNAKFLSYTGTLDYFSYMVWGAAFYTYAIAILMNVGRSLMQELRDGTLMTLLITPVKMVNYFAGILAAQIVFSLTEMGAIIVFGIILGVHFVICSVFDVIIIVILATLSIYSMSLLLSGIMLYTRDTYLSQNTMFLFVQFFCGVVFPIQYLPEVFQKISECIPFTYALSVFRSVILGQKTLMEMRTDLMIMIILSIVYYTLAIIIVEKSKFNFIENGFE